MVTWLIQWAAMTINIGRRGIDGKTTWERRHGRPCRRSIAECGEKILWLPTGKHKSHLEERYLPGVFLGIALHRNDILVGKANGSVGLARSFRRLPESQRVDVMLLRGVRGVPWCPDPKVGAEVAVAVAPAPLVRDCMELYTWQLQRGKAFLHEQPCGAQCWNEPCMRKLIEMHGVEWRRGDQCPFGPQVRGNDEARALVLKPTIWVSNCLEILDEVCERCSNNRRPRREWHKHTSTLTGTCSHAERYPVRLVRAILRGLRRALRRGLPGGGHLRT